MMSAKPSHSLVLSPFFWLAFTVYMGIAGQSAGLYLFGFFIPACLWAGRLSSQLQRACIGFGLLMLMAWLIFPCFDLLNHFWGVPLRVAQLIPAELHDAWVVHRSQLPSTWGIVGWGFVALGVVSRHVSASSRDSEPLLEFAKGALWASVIIGCYYGVQFFTGWEHRGPDYQLGDNNQLSSGFYRVFGFYGHTLSVSGVALVFLGFYAGLWWGGAWQRARGWLLALIVINAGFLFLAGGRMAVALGLLLVFGGVFGFLWRRGLRWWAVAGTSSLGLMAGVMLWRIGVFQRASEAWVSWQSGQVEGSLTRVIFWQVYGAMVQDAPWLGHGAGRIRELLKEPYYTALGFEGLARKYNAHNIYLEVLANLGIIGGLLLGGLILWLGWLWHRQVLAPLGRGVVLACALALGLNGLHGLTQNVFFDAHIVAAYLAMFAVIFWQRVLSEAQGDRVDR